MGLVYSEITLRNRVHPEIEPMKVKCLVDTGSIFLVLPQRIADALRLQVLQETETTLANGARY